MKTRQSGFTLVELMVTLAVVVVLIGLAVPSFQTLLVSQRLNTAADMLISDFRYARSEAIKRTNQVTICVSSNGTSCTSDALWKDGWIVFVDDNGNKVVDDDDLVVRVQEALPGIEYMGKSATSTSDLPAFRFEASGWAKGATQTFWIYPTGSTAMAEKLKRLVCISTNGRARLMKKGEPSCAS